MSKTTNKTFTTDQLDGYRKTIADLSDAVDDALAALDRIEHGDLERAGAEFTEFSGSISDVEFYASMLRETIDREEW